MRRRLLHVVISILMISASGWWTYSQYGKFAALQGEVGAERSRIAGMLAELKKLPERPPRLPDTSEAQGLLSALSAPLVPQEFGIALQPPDKSNPRLSYRVVFASPSGYEGALSVLDRFLGRSGSVWQPGAHPVSVTRVEMQKKGDRLVVGFSGYVAVSSPSPAGAGKAAAPGREASP